MSKIEIASKIFARPGDRKEVKEKDTVGAGEEQVGAGEEQATAGAAATDVATSAAAAITSSSCSQALDPKGSECQMKKQREQRILSQKYYLHTLALLVPGAARGPRASAEAATPTESARGARTSAEGATTAERGATERSNTRERRWRGSGFSGTRTAHSQPCAEFSCFLAVSEPLFVLLAYSKPLLSSSLIFVQ